MRLIVLLLLLLAAPAHADPPSPTAAQYRADALALEGLVNLAYAYPERLPGGTFRLTDRLRTEAGQVGDRRSLLRFAERALMLLADPHAITGSSLPDSWAVVPSYSDLWIERAGPDFVVEAVRAGSPAEAAGVRPGDRLVSVGGVATGRAVAAFWEDLGVEEITEARAVYAARILAAGRRDRPRRLGFGRGRTDLPPVELASLYAAPRQARAPLTATEEHGALRIRFNDSLGDSAAIVAFDAAMAGARPGRRVILDLRDTPGGGNTVVARAILGWFVDRPRFYQMHNLPAEARETGIPRQWVEQVLPRAGKHFAGGVSVEVGRWTGSMGEGLAIGFDAIGAEVRGSRMAGLLGAVYDHRLDNSGLVIKLPTERVMTTRGKPREGFVPRPQAARIAGRAQN